MPEPSYRRLFEGGGALVWPAIVAIALVHYTAPSEPEWVHDVARRLQYLPIVLAGIRGGISGGLLAALATNVVYLPHAFGIHGAPDPGGSAEKLLEMGFYLVLGALAGGVAERQHRERAVHETLSRLLADSVAESRGKDGQLARAARLEALGHLTAGLAHEIRNPLHAMRGTAEILLDFVPREAAERPLAQAHLGEIDRLSRLLTRFLSFARTNPPDRRPVALGDVVRRVGELLRAQAAQQETALELEDGAEVGVSADFEQLVQVVLALAINGLQALERGGALGISVQGTDAHGVIAVRNDGPPIPEDLIEQIFDPFVSTRPEGTGLGLASAWRIAADHGGVIEVENLADGAGVVFRLVLPVGRPVDVR